MLLCTYMYVYVYDVSVCNSEYDVSVCNSEYV